MYSLYLIIFNLNDSQLLHCLHCSNSMSKVLETQKQKDRQTDGEVPQARFTCSRLFSCLRDPSSFCAWNPITGLKEVLLMLLIICPPLILWLKAAIIMLTTNFYKKSENVFEGVPTLKTNLSPNPNFLLLSKCALYELLMFAKTRRIWDG